ncbi:unnamed protein product [Lupinus luteus]|uniref:Reverse transcriptase domain-containing protein n=1 Tax=Lupinus luteus TaxID=3873 RepID=A0AAV1YFS4_LUPLU
MVGYFKCTRGVRQGDPLSPILFCLAEDVLSRGITKLLSERKISTISGPKGIQTPSHVLYADDIFIFCKVKRREILQLTSLIHIYVDASGQCVNASKSKFYTASTSTNKIASLTQVLGFSNGFLPLMYLGVPIFLGKPRKIYLERIADKIIQKLATWKGSLLFIMGRIELVKSVIQNMLIFSFNIYAWPATLLNHLDKCIRNFIWSGNIEVRKLVTVAWKNVCLPLKEGGLGIRSIKKMNQAAMLKLTWEMLHSNQEWARFFRNRFGHTPNPSTRYFKSSIWPAIKANWHMVHMNSVWIIGDGKTTNFWIDNWLGEPLADTLNIPWNLQKNLNASVADFIIDKSWIIPHSLNILYPQLLDLISNTYISSNPDIFIWQKPSDGFLTAKEAYAHCNPGTFLSNWGKTIWSTSIPPANSFTTWRLLNNKMPTDENLQSRGCALASKCDLCRLKEDSTQHLFLQCSFAKSIWQWLGSTLSLNLDLSSVNNLLKATKLNCSD